MLLYLRVAKRPNQPDPPTPTPQSSTLESSAPLEQDSLARHHRAEAHKVYQKAREDHLCERRFML
ncbi:hypothetical protein ACQ4N7_17095 [Nodosilinea sp. AN01ver1]|uniref:hypothetical protein n=1 Tax=Nodosilinea sp. AN01ver1 TaxID=3423362 RepID=UPI003D3158D7